MTKTSKTIVFFGSGPVAAASLGFLAQHFKVEAVITKPTTVQEMANALKAAAGADRPPVYSVATANELETLIAERQFSSPAGVLVDFGIIVPQPVINHFPLGIINSHFSLLPRWRGADPISFAILNGDGKTGVSLMLISPEMDTGPLLTYKSLPIAANATTPSLTKELIGLSNQLLLEHLPRYLDGQLKAKAQPHPDRATYSRKLTKADGILDFTKSAAELERQIRAFWGWPKSRATLGGKDVIITKAYAVPGIGTSQKPGQLTVASEAKTLGVATGQGTLWIEKLKPAGKKEMTAKEFLAGYGQLLKPS